MEDQDFLPGDHLKLAGVPEWDFAYPRSLPDHRINTAYTGWQGRARCDQPQHSLRVYISAPKLDVAMVHAPALEADFFCFEPVSHAVDAANRPGQPGLTSLDTGQSLSFAMTIDWESAEHEL